MGSVVASSSRRQTCTAAGRTPIPPGRVTSADLPEPGAPASTSTVAGEPSHSRMRDRTQGLATKRDFVRAVTGDSHDRSAGPPVGH
jgi:hypothetical protein